METRAPSSERQVWHHGAAAPLNAQFTPFQHESLPVPKVSARFAVLESPRVGGLACEVRGKVRANEVSREQEGSKEETAAAARERGKQRGGGGGEVRSYVAVHHARVEEMGRGGAGPR